MQSLITFGLTVIPTAICLCAGVWVLENTKLGDIVVRLLEKVLS